MIYTSFFANYKNFPKESLILGITRWPPDGVKNCGHLAPDEKLLRQFKNKEIDEFIFSVKYLEKLDKEEIIKYLQDLEKEYTNIILCCYEKTGDFCHRHILANWLSPEIIIKEL